MAGKVVDGPEADLHAGVLFEAKQREASAQVLPLRFSLSGTVHVDFDVTLTDDDGSLRHTVVRVEFPDEVRSMLEASSWTRGMTIHEALARLGASFLERVATGGLAGTFADGTALRRPSTLHLPLSYVRARLAMVCAAAS